MSDYRIVGDTNITDEAMGKLHDPSLILGELLSREWLNPDGSLSIELRTVETEIQHFLDTLHVCHCQLCAIIFRRCTTP